MLDPVTVAVLKGRLEQIADEMDATLFRTAFNPIIAEAHDASHGIYDPCTGETLVQGKSGLPIFVGAMSFAVQAVIEKVKKEGNLNEGDIFLFNDPYDGATHLNDFKLVQPLFRNDKLFCFMASVGHWHDVGGNVPGNYNPVAQESFQEGFRIPPVKIQRSGVFQKDILDILLANTRLPRSCYGDLHAQLNALKLGQKRMHELLDDYGDNTVQEAMELLKKRAEKLMRAQISELPDGSYYAEDYLDNDGQSEKAIKIALTLSISGTQMTLDFSGTAPPCNGPLNIARSTTISGCYVALKHLFKEVPANSGCLAPIDFIIPEPSLLSVQAPKPVGGYTETVLRVIDLVFVAISKADPKRSNGGAYGTINALSLAGFRKDGSRWVLFSFFGGGLGGNPQGDGLNHGNAPISTATIPPIEILEAAYPVLFNQWALRPDSGGAGENRGGLGATYEIELLEEEADLFFFGERARFAPPGVVGGQAAAKTVFSYQQDDGIHTPPLSSKLVGKKLKKGQSLCIKSPGGGGYGPPEKRSPASIQKDLSLGYLTQKGAIEQYGVEFAGDGSIKNGEKQ